MRSKILAALLAALFLAGCGMVGQAIHDEQARQACYEIITAEAKRACLNELEGQTPPR